MKLPNSDLETLLDRALTAAGNAAAYIQSEAGKQQHIQRKEGGSSLASRVVTKVDLTSQQIILDTLQESIAKYDLGLLTEECPDDSSRHRRDHFWCIDPLDGTLAFTEGIAGYAVVIALVARSGVPQLGVIADPATGTTFHALRGHGLFRNGERFAPSRKNPTLHWMMDRSFRELDCYAPVTERLGEIAAAHDLDGVDIVSHGGAAMNACWVLENSPAVYFKFPRPGRGGGSIWDFAASACLGNEVPRAVVSDAFGDPLKLNREGGTFMNKEGVVMASSRSLASAVYALRSEFC